MHHAQILLLLSICINHVMSSSNTGSFADSLFTFRDSACERERLILRCPRGATIRIQWARYGRMLPSSEMCPYMGQNPLKKMRLGKGENTNCVSNSSMEVVLDLCQDKESCKVAATSRTFGDDPCPGTSKYVEVGYKCRPGEFSSRSQCEGRKLAFGCRRKSHKIAIYSAFFGRDDYGAPDCEESDIVFERGLCTAECATDIVMRECQGHRRCKIMATNDVFNSNCLSGIPKYLKVIYACVPRRILKEIDHYENELSTNTFCDAAEGRPTLPTAMPTRRPIPTLPTAFTTISSTTTTTTTSTTTMATTSTTTLLATTQPQQIRSTTDATTSQRTIESTHIIPRSTGYTDTDDISSIGDVTSPANTTLDGVPVVKSSQGIVYIGFINDWIRTYNYIKDNLERCLLYVTLSVCLGLIFVLVIIAIRLNIVSNKYRRHAKLDITEPMPHNSGGIVGSTVVQQVSPDEDLTSLGSSSNNDLNSMDMYGMSHNSRRPPPFPTNDSLNRTLNHYYG